MYENGTNLGNEPECNDCRQHERLEVQRRAEIAELRRKFAAIVVWLEHNQPDVFKRGLWDVTL